jgi:UDP:flavonoid glycosyltransferase YjiC (YdhE family)
LKVLLCSLDSPGFLFPAIGLAVALRAAGHEVAFVTAGGAAARLAGQGLRRIPCGERDSRSFETAHWFAPLAVALQVKHIEHALRSFAADVLVGQTLTLGPLIVGERWGLPVAVQGLATHLWPGGGASGAASAAAEERRAWRLADMLGHLNAARALVRLPAVSVAAGAGPLLGDLHWLRSVEELHGGPGLPGRLHLVGACLWEPAEEDEELAAWLDEAAAAGRPIAYVQQGRTFGTPGFWAPLVEAFGGGEVRIAAASGRMDGPGGLAEAVPAGWFVRPHVHQGAVLRRAALMIGSATSTAVLGALSHGVPCVLVPGGGEQLELAEQVERAGAGQRLAPAGLTAAALRRPVAAALGDGGLHRRAAELRAAFARVDGFAVSTELLERLAAPRHGAVGAPRQAARERG